MRYGFGRAREFFWVVEGREYDSKAIAGAAHGFQHRQLRPLTAGEFSFSGGEATVRRVMESLGFEIRVRRIGRS